MKSKKKILIIVAIVLIIILALAGTVAGMVMTGKMAFTTRQKLAKGLSDIGSKAEISEFEEKFKEQEKMKQTPFEAETTITGKVNKIELSNTTGVEEVIEEIESAINNTKITNTLKADLKNNIINEKLSINLADIIEEISMDAEYNNGRVSLKSKELNDKYITFTKDDIQSDNQNEELEEVINIFERICNNQTTSFSLTDTEKAHFVEKYQGIFSEYITDAMLREEKTEIIVDGEKKQCNSINFTLDKNQIVELIGKYLKTLEEDETGKQIIVTKIQSISNTFDVEDLQEMIDDLKYELLYLEDNATMKCSLYCTMFTTYGFDIEFYFNNEEYTMINLILGKEEDKLSISTDEEISLEAVRTSNRLEVNLLGEEENAATLILKTNGTQKVLTLEINDVDDNMKINLTLTNDQISKTANEKQSSNTIQIAIQSEQNNIDITFNIDTSLTYVNSIEETTFTNENSVNIITGSQAEIQQYLNEVNNNAILLIRDGAQNSKIIQKVYEVIALYKELSGGSAGQISNQTPQNFNSMFKEYTGIQQGSSMKILLGEISTNNSLDAIHKISVGIVEDGNKILNATTNSEEISLAKNNINVGYQYEVLATSVDPEGYITGIEIRKK